MENDIKVKVTPTASGVEVEFLDPTSGRIRAMYYESYPPMISDRAAWLKQLAAYKPTATFDSYDRSAINFPAAINI